MRLIVLAVALLALLLLVLPPDAMMAVALIALIGALLIFVGATFRAVVPMRCPDCRAVMLGHPRFCPRCGREL